MAGELEPMPLADILAAVGFKTAMGDWPPGFDVAHGMLTLVNVTERLRRSIVAHHEEIEAHDMQEMTLPCPICVKAQGVDPDDVLTDVKAPDFPPVAQVPPCECAGPLENTHADGNEGHNPMCPMHPRNVANYCNCGGNHSAYVGDTSPGAGHAVNCPVRVAYPWTAGA